MKKTATRKTKAAGKTAAPKRRKTVTFLHKTNCSTCRKARTFMTRRGYKLHVRDLREDPLSAAEWKR